MKSLFWVLGFVIAIACEICIVGHLYALAIFLGLSSIGYWIYGGVEGIIEAIKEGKQ
jgi:hypothetical protein